MTCRVTTETCANLYPAWLNFLRGIFIIPSERFDEHGDEVIIRLIFMSYVCAIDVTRQMRI